MLLSNATLFRRYGATVARWFSEPSVVGSSPSTVVFFLIIFIIKLLKNYFTYFMQCIIGFYYL